MLCVVAPRRAIVHQHARRQTVDAEDGGQFFPHCLRSFVGACAQPQGEAGVIVQDGQRVTAPCAGGEVPLEVHLPEVVGLRVLEPLPVTMGAFAAHGTAVPPQDGRDGAGARHRALPPIQQHLAYGAASPRGVLLAERQDGLFRLSRCAGRRVVRAAGALDQPRLSLLRMAVQQLVGRGRRDCVAPAEFTDVRSFRAGQCDELTLQGHRCHLLPGDGAPPAASQADRRCKPCPRTGVQYVPGLYTLEGRGRRAAAGEGEPVRCTEHGSCRSCAGRDLASCRDAPLGRPFTSPPGRGRRAAAGEGEPVRCTEHGSCRSCAGRDLASCRDAPLGRPFTSPPGRGRRAAAGEGTAGGVGSSVWFVMLSVAGGEVETSLGRPAWLPLLRERAEVRALRGGGVALSC